MVSNSCSVKGYRNICKRHLTALFSAFVVLAFLRNTLVAFCEYVAVLFKTQGHFEMSHLILLHSKFISQLELGFSFKAQDLVYLSLIYKMRRWFSSAILVDCWMALLKGCYINVQ